MKTLVIGDTHFNQKRVGALTPAWKSIFCQIKGQKFDSINLLGDIFDKFPNMYERLMFADVIGNLKAYSKNIQIIKGTGRHAYQEGVYHLADIIQLTDIQAHDQLELGKFLFVHDDIVGLKYASGHKCDKGLDLKDYKGKHVVAGHFHSPYDAESLTVLGSVYKTNFSEIYDEKRILITEDDKLTFLPIKSRPMYQIELIGQLGKIKNVKLPKEKDIDLKIIANTDTQTLPEVNRVIAKIKEKYDTEYYQEDISISSIKVSVPKNLDRKELLKDYAEKQKCPFDIVEKELKWI